uniref:Rho GTPase-activating protein 32 n=1 Tax=Xenopus tropicalis TaxID=8364 RepID=A0A803K8C5_XENTR
MEGGTDAAAFAAFPSIHAVPSTSGRMATGGKLDELERIMKSSLHLEEDDFVPELPRSIHPRERPDWEETISAMARGADIPVPGEIPTMPTEIPLRSCGSTASMKVKNVKKLSFTKGHFPKLAECAHFHYENVDFGSIQLTLTEDQNEVSRNGCESKELVFLVQIACQGRSWIVKRSYEDFRVLDKHLHLCIYDRRFSQLSELPRSDSVKDSPELVTQMLMAYLSRLSAIAGNKINCGPALTWMEIDNKGNHLLVHEESSINVPAIAAAHVIKRYNAQAPDELSFEVGDIVSVIDMPPKELTTWWRGKHGFQVGFFPSECVELINDKVPQSMTNSVPKPVSRKHGKLITFLRTFMKSRPSKQKLKQRGILRERVFGCDLGEHLLNSGQDVPQVLRSCTEFIEKHGIVDGIYRLSGIASNIQKLRHEFDSEQIPDLTKDVYIQDIHCVGSLCKLYFRELPNPLLTYQLYEKFSDAVSAATDEERLVKIHDVIQQLPPPHYRTLEFLMRHLSRLATYCSITNMHTKNLAIVWAPNLLRSKQIESACFSGTAAFMEVRIQSVVVEFILNHVEVLFSPKLSSVIRDGAGHTSLSRPKSLLVSSPSTKLLSLEEAQARTQAQINSPVVADSKYIEVGEGPAALQGRFHTVIDFPSERKRPPTKMKKSPVGSWRSFFSIGKSSSSASMSKRKLQRNPSEPLEMKSMAFAGGRDSSTMRSAKSEESLSSLHAADGESKLFRPRRPRSSSDALSASYNGDLLDSCNRCNSYDNLPRDQDSDGDEGLIHVPAMLSGRSPEDEELSPPDIATDPWSTVTPVITQWNPDGLQREDKAGPFTHGFPQPNSDLEQVENFNLELSTTNVAAAYQKEDTELSRANQNKSHSSVSPPQGASASESPQELAPVSSVSIIPPPPPPKNPARMLALALAESAQQASANKRPLYMQFMDLPPHPPPPSVLEDKPLLELSPKMSPEHLVSGPATPATSPPVISNKTSPATPPSTTSSFSITTIHHSPVKNHSPLAGQMPTAVTPGLSPSSNQVPVSFLSDEMLPSETNKMNSVILSEAFTTGIPVTPPSEKPKEISRPPHLHQRSESFPSHPAYSNAKPTPPVRTMDSRLATAMHSNFNDAITANNYHSFLNTMMLPSSLEDVLPRHNYSHSSHLKTENIDEQGVNYRQPYLSNTKQEDPADVGDLYRQQYISTGKSENAEIGNTYRHPYPSNTEPESLKEPLDPFLHHKSAVAPKTYRAETLLPHMPPQVYGSRCDTPSSTFYGTYINQAKHPRTRNRPDYMSSMSPGLRSYSEDTSSYPTIRRVQSLHVPMQPPPPPIRTVPISRTEVPPDDDPAYCPRPVYQYKQCPQFNSQSDYHVTQLQPYFENGRVHYRYSPYSGGPSYFSADSNFYDMDPYSTLRLRQLPLYPSRDFASYTTRLQPKNTYRSQGLPPYPRGTLREHNFISRDVPPALPPEHPRPLHISWDMEDMDRYRLQSLRRENRARQRAKGPVMSQYDNVTPTLVEDVAGLDVIHLRSRSDPGKTPGLLSVAENKDVRYPGRAEGDEHTTYPPPVFGNGHQDKPSLPQKQSGSSRVRMQHEISTEQRTQPSQDTLHRQPTEGRNGPPIPPVDYSSKGMPNPPDPASYHSSANKYNLTQQEPMRLIHKELRLPEDIEHSHTRPADNQHRDCYREEPAQFPLTAPPPKPERSHSLRGHNPDVLERDPSIFYPYQTLQAKRHSTINAVSQYDNLADYHSIPHHRTTNQSTPNAFNLPHGRTYATALGQGAFLAAELGLQRPETKIHVE